MEDRKYYITNALPEHVECLGHRLRQADLDEVWASDHSTGYEALKESLARSEIAYSVFYKGKVIAMFGVAPIGLLGGGMPWLLGSDEIEEVKIPFARYSRKFVEYFIEKYMYLENCADSRNTVALEWLRFCGFTIQEARPFGPDKVPFHRFFMKRGEK
jgi:hypothetical protein